MCIRDSHQHRYHPRVGDHPGHFPLRGNRRGRGICWTRARPRAALLFFPLSAFDTRCFCAPGVGPRSQRHWTGEQPRLRACICSCLYSGVRQHRPISQSVIVQEAYVVRLLLLDRRYHRPDNHGIFRVGACDTILLLTAWSVLGVQFPCLL